VKLAIVHDYLNQFGGAERVVETLHETFPSAPIFTTIFDKTGMPPQFADMDVRTSFLQYFPFVMKHYKPYLMLFPPAIESLRIKGYDVVLSSSSAFAKGVKVPERSCHICYCHTPMRFAWRYEDYMREENLNPLAKALLPFAIKRIKNWDIATSSGVDHFIANSNVVAERIKRSYGRKSTVINPPVDTEKYNPKNVESNYYLIVARLNPYKRIELAVEAFNEMKLPLKIVGEGAYKNVLMKLAGPNIEFLGRQGDRELSDLYAGCRALIFPGEEDFGIVPLEAASAGRPTIAFRGGGAFETVIEDKTGVFFNEHSVGSLKQAVERFQSQKFDKTLIRDHALKFGKEVFIGKIKSFVEEKLNEFKSVSG